MYDRMDFNGDGEVDDMEKFLAYEMLCASIEEHELMYAGLDRVDLKMMGPEERREALVNAGLDPDEYDFD